jgi:hypothetical protein
MGTDYACSIKRLKTGLPDNEYRKQYDDLLFDLWNQYGVLGFNKSWFFEEYDKHKILHLHGIISLPKKFKYIKLMTKGFNINITVLRDSGWEKYAKKAHTMYRGALAEDTATARVANYDLLHAEHWVPHKKLFRV